MLAPCLWLPNQLLHVYTNIPFLKVVNLRASSRQALAGAAFAIFCQSAACLVLYFLPALQHKHADLLEYYDSSRHDKGDIHHHIMVYYSVAISLCRSSHPSRTKLPERFCQQEYHPQCGQQCLSLGSKCFHRHVFLHACLHPSRRLHVGAVVCAEARLNRSSVPCLGSDSAAGVGHPRVLGTLGLLAAAEIGQGPHCIRSSGKHMHMAN